MASFRALINLADRTSVFNTTPSGATATLTQLSALVEGANDLEFRLADVLGNTAQIDVAYAVVLAVANHLAFDFPAASSPVPVLAFNDITLRVERPDNSLDPNFSGVVRMSTTDPFSLLNDLHVPIDLGDDGQKLLEKLAVFLTTGTHTVSGETLDAVPITGELAGIQVVAGPPAALTLISGGDDRNVLVGTVPSALTVEVSDALGNGVSGVGLEVKVGSVVTLTDTTVVGGTALFSLPTLMALGNVVVTVSAPSLPVLDSQTFTLAVTDLPFISSLADGDFTNDPSLSLNGFAPAGEVVTILLDGLPIGTTTAGLGGDFNFSPPAGVSEGVHNLVVVIDFGGPGETSSTPIIVTLDFTAPLAPMFTAPAQGAVLAGLSFELALTAESDTEVEVFDGATSLGLAAESGDFRLVTVLANGAHLLTATATDQAGNTSLPSVTLNISTGPNPFFGVVLDTRRRPLAPLKGVTLAFKGSGLSTFSDGNGRFFFGQVPIGSQVVEVAGPAPLLPLEIPVTLVDAAINPLGRPLMLFAKDVAGTVAVPLNPVTEAALSTVVIQTPNLSPASLVIPVGTRVHFPASVPAEITMTAISAAFPPHPLPAGVTAPAIVNFSPNGTLLPDGATLTLPNVDGLLAGSTTPLYHLDAVAGGWVVIDQGQVSGDGLTISSTLPVVVSFSPFFFQGAVPTGPVEVRGCVVDGGGNPLTGVTVTIEGQAEATAADGTFLFSIADNLNPSGESFFVDLTRTGVAGCFTINRHLGPFPSRRGGDVDTGTTTVDMALGLVRLGGGAAVVSGGSAAPELSSATHRLGLELGQGLVTPIAPGTNTPQTLDLRLQTGLLPAVHDALPPVVERFELVATFNFTGGSLDFSDSFAEGQVDVSRQPKFHIIMSEDITNASLGTLVTVTQGATSIAGTVTYDAGARTIVWEPSGGPLAVSSAHTLTVSANLRDAQGNRLGQDIVRNFTTTDGTAVAIANITTAPANAAIGVALTTPIRVTFPEAMQAETIVDDDASNAGSPIQLTQGGTPVLGHVTYDPSTFIASFVPEKTLKTNNGAGLGYVLTVSTAVKDLGGSAIASNKTATFTVVADAAGPSVAASIPSDTQTGIWIDAQVRVTFSEAMDPATITTASFRVDNPSNVAQAGDVSYDRDTNTAVFTPSIVFADNTIFTVKLAATIFDRNGNALVTPNRMFTTGSSRSTDDDDNDGLTNVEEDQNSNFIVDPGETDPGNPDSDGDGLNDKVEIFTNGTDPNKADTDGDGFDDAIDMTPLVASVDNIAPEVLSTSPETGATSVFLDVNVEMRLSEPFDPLTVTGTSFSVTQAPGGPVAGILSFVANNTVVVFNPTSNFTVGAVVSVSLTVAITDIAGNALVVPATPFTFTMGTTTTDAPAFPSQEPYRYNNPFEVLTFGMNKPVGSGGSDYLPGFPVELPFPVGST
ncbi:Ig-like domain-containing protein [bacterium AH-315-F18]|nr:Ig-like domain-containing protein [bacterium AH-315-F18]